MRPTRLRRVRTSLPHRVPRCRRVDRRSYVVLQPCSDGHGGRKVLSGRGGLRTHPLTSGTLRMGEAVLCCDVELDADQVEETPPVGPG